MLAIGDGWVAISQDFARNWECCWYIINTYIINIYIYPFDEHDPDELMWKAQEAYREQRHLRAKEAEDGRSSASKKAWKSQSNRACERLRAEHSNTFWIFWSAISSSDTFCFFSPFVLRSLFGIMISHGPKNDYGVTTASSWFFSTAQVQAPRVLLMRWRRCGGSLLVWITYVKEGYNFNGLDNYQIMMFATCN